VEFAAPVLRLIHSLSVRTSKSPHGDTS